MKKTALLLIILSLVFGAAVISWGVTPRKAVVAGSFYPADSTELRAKINKYLSEAADLPQIDGHIIALVVPHAGLIYSGGIAAYAYKLIEGTDINKVILCGPSHHYPFDGLSVYGPNIVWYTPFGRVDCQGRMSLDLIHYDKNINFEPKAHTAEHSIEIQLPYLQTVLNDFKIVPISVGQQNKSTIDLLTNALKSIEFDEQTIMIASTDLQHYRSAAEGWPMDSLIVSCVENLDPVRLQILMQSHQVELCGGGPLVSVMKAAIARGANKALLLKYGDSGDLSGDKSSVVGYLAAVFYQSNKNIGKVQKESPDDSEITKKKELPKQFVLENIEKKELLNISRETLESYLSSGQIPEFEVSDNLKKFGAAFVTLEKDNQLRGCIGHTSAVEPLYKTVIDCAIQAAVGDRRFSPVTRAELDKLHIEISVLSPMQKVDSWDEIEVGRDGLMIFRGERRGLLLPQVATDYGWDRQTFLEQTCFKAGLPIDAYKDPDAIIYKFQAVIFGE
jgi:MEMO1 family protein